MEKNNEKKSTMPHIVVTPIITNGKPNGLLLCPDCKVNHLRRQMGCLFCPVCGWSKCG
jgi:hypothetical protein